MSIGIHAWFGFKLPPSSRMSLIAKHGFESTSLWLGYPEGLGGTSPAHMLPRMARDAGLVVDSAHAPCAHSNFLWSPSLEDRLLVKMEYCESMEFCVTHHIPIMVLHVSDGPNPPDPRDSGLKVLRELVRFGEDHGVTLAFENTDRPDHLAFVLSEIKSDSVRFCYDSSHDNLAGRPFSAILKKWAHLLVTTHFSDNCGITDDHFLPGLGTINWEMLRKAFADVCYRGNIMLEVLPCRERHNDARGFLDEAFRSGCMLRTLLTGPPCTNM